MSEEGREGGKEGGLSRHVREGGLSRCAREDRTDM